MQRPFKEQPQRRQEKYGKIIELTSTYSCPSRICWFRGHIGPLETPFFCGECLVPRARRAEMGWTEHKVISGWEELDGRWFMANYKPNKGIWADVPWNNNWQPPKQLDMMVGRCQRCCTQLSTGMEHVQKHANLNCCRKLMKARDPHGKQDNSTTQLRSGVVACPHEQP